MSLPTAAYTAVLYQAPISADTNDDADASIRMSEPLLPRSHDSDNSQQTFESSFLPRLKTLSFISGCAIAILSQYILSLALWSDAIMTQSAERVVFFSLGWSMATCAMVFLSMLLLVRNVTKTVAMSMQQSRAWMDATFQMEAHHIIGALLTISLTWIVIDVFRVSPSGLVKAGLHGWWSVATICGSLFAYLAFYKCMLRGSHEHGSYAAVNHIDQTDSNATRDSSLMNTYQLIAGTLGLLAGLCSQFFLSFALWKNQMTEPLLDNVIVFSLVWSISTVAVTFCGCLSLRLLTSDHARMDDDSSNDKTFIRMESYYVFFSLIGICLAWILIDIVLDMREQIFPSLLMLSVSLACFGVILQCFPEPHRASLESEVMDSVVAIESTDQPTVIQNQADVMMV
ncbi:hypothetical protein MPSEU_000973800 [Mayamaea pseudoterrestris]|nr:hypothetical protein MPSEU_000973800 [Mayamaea pseudoterrestris]